VSIWSSVGINEGVVPDLVDGFTSYDVDVAIAYSWTNGIRVMVFDDDENIEGVMNRDSAVLLRDRLTEAIETLDRRSKS
jgi:hypothetical protein